MGWGDVGWGEVGWGEAGLKAHIREELKSSKT